MTKIAWMAGLALAVSIGPAAVAQTTAAPPSPAKLALAEKLIELSGGQQQMRASLAAIYGAVFASVDRNLPPEQKRFASFIQQDLQAGMMSLAPKFIDISAAIYAKDLSEKEMSDYIVFQESPSGQAIRARGPEILKDVMTAIIPTVQDAMPAIMQKVVVDVCAESKCTDADRQMIAAIMAKAAHRSQS